MLPGPTAFPLAVRPARETPEAAPLLRCRLRISARPACPGAAGCGGQVGLMCWFSLTGIFLAAWSVALAASLTVTSRMPCP